ncbi:MAG: hypothetical protein K8823_1486 [Cenarchaeum symbiont of Oopsacas minuta]|nr:hypothetical protein [Cenarchaeum symbiont of Oopsacas minuta]
MPQPIKHTVFDIIEKAKSLTDSELEKVLIKNTIVIPNDMLNKILLDLEIMGKINVTWLSKDARRIEIIDTVYEIDEVDQQNAKVAERDYESVFPGT